MHFDYKCTAYALKQGLKNLKVFNKALEIGSGPGTWTEYIVQKFNTIHAVELSETMIKEAKKNKNLTEVEFYHSDFLEFQTSEKYDTIISVRSFEYFSDKSAFLKKCYELLKPGGIILIISKTKGSYWYGKSKVRKILKKTIPSFFKYENQLFENTNIDYQENFWQERVFLSQIKKLLRKSGFIPLFHRPVIIRPPIFMRGKSEVPLIPPKLEKHFIKIISLINKLLRELPQATIFAESFIILAKKSNLKN